MAKRISRSARIRARKQGALIREVGQVTLSRRIDDKGNPVRPCQSYISASPKVHDSGRIDRYLKVPNRAA